MVEQGQDLGLPEEENDKDKKKRRRSFLLSWLDVRASANSADTTGDRLEKQPSGFSVLLRRLFEREVRMDPVSETAHDKVDSKSEDELAWQFNIEQPQAANSVSGQKEEPTRPAVDTASTDRMPSAEEPEEYLALDNTDEPEAPMADFPPLSVRELREAGAHFAYADNARPAADRLVDIAASPEAKRTGLIAESNKQEPLAVLALVGLGAEYLARKRQGKAQIKRISNLERKAVAQDRKLEYQDAELQKRVTKAEASRPADSQSVRRPPETKNKTTQPQEREPAFVPSKEQAPTPMETKPSLSKDKNVQETAERVTLYEGKRPAPPAEVDTPVESIYARRQEVKDAPSISRGYNAPVPISAILQSMTTVSSVANYSSVAGGRVHTNQTLSSNNQLYKQAVHSGFWSAIAIVIFALGVYLFS